MWLTWTKPIGSLLLPTLLAESKLWLSLRLVKNPPLIKISDSLKCHESQHINMMDVFFLLIAGPTLGRWAWRLPAHSDPSQGARVLSGVLTQRQVLGIRILRSNRAHLVHWHGKAGPQLQGHRGNIRGMSNMQSQVFTMQVATYIAEKTVRPLNSATTVVSAKVVVACILKRDPS